MTMGDYYFIHYFIHNIDEFNGMVGNFLLDNFSGKEKFLDYQTKLFHRFKNILYLLLVFLFVLSIYLVHTHLTFTYSKLAVESLEKGVKYIQS